MSIWSKIYSKINWKDEPIEETPLSARNLNKMDSALDEIDKRVVEVNNRVETLVTAEQSGDEVTDIRVGYDGKIYPSAGDAVREQLSGLNTDLVEVEDEIILLNGFDVNDITTGGRLSNVDGVTLDTSVSDYVSCNRYARVKGNTNYSLWYTNNGFVASLYCRVCWYDTNKNFISSTDNTSSNIITSPANAKYARVCVDRNRMTTTIFYEGEEVPNNINSFGYGTNAYYSLDIKKDINNVSNIPYIDKSFIVNKTINNGDVVENNQKYIYCLNRVLTLPKDITISIKTGWVYHLFYYINGIQTSPTPSWLMTVDWTIPANTPFIVYFYKDNQDLSTIDEAFNSITFNGYTKNDSISNKEIPTYYYDGDSLCLKKNQLKSNYLGLLELNKPSVENGGAQSMELYENTLIVAMNELLNIYSYNDLSFIAQYNVNFGHANSLQFSDEKYDVNDLTPMAYVSNYNANSNTITKIQITNSGVNTIETINLPIENAGYYAECCIDNDNKYLYSLGYKIQSGSTSDNNYIIVSKWDIKNNYSLVSTFNIPFIPICQGIKFYKGKIIVCYSVNTTNSGIVIIDIEKQSINSRFISLPPNIKNGEIEDTMLIPTYYGYNLGLILANGELYSLEVD